MKYFIASLTMLVLLATTVSANVPLTDYWSVTSTAQNNDITFYIDNFPASATAALDLQLGLTQERLLETQTQSLSEIDNKPGVIVAQTIPTKLNAECKDKMQKARQYAGFCKINEQNFLVVYGVTPKDISEVVDLLKYNKIEDKEFFVHSNVTFIEPQPKETVAEKVVTWVANFFE